MQEQDVLVVDDNPADARVLQEAVREGPIAIHLSMVEDGVQALAFLRRAAPYADAPRPALILLDLNMPRKNGFEVLAELKADESLRSIPVIVFTTSAAERDVLSAYNLRANGYVTKPVDFDQLIDVMRSIEQFWLHVVRRAPE